MMNAEKAYEKKIRELMAKVGRLEDAEVARVMAMLLDAQKDIAAMTATTEWQAYRIPQMKEAVERAIERFRQRYAESQADALSNMWKAGIDIVDIPLATVGIRIAAPEISMTLLEVLQGYSVDLIKGLTQDAAKKINAEIMQGVMGGKQPFEVMKAIGRNLDDPSVFRTIFGRAETITRTEMAHIHSTAREARNQATVAASPELEWLKKWISSHKFHPRPHHEELDGETVPVGKNFPYGLPYPHAPGLPAIESINCG